MTKKKTAKKQAVSDRGQDIISQLEQAFVAGLGALSDAQEAGTKAFDKLVEQGQKFRQETEDKTEEVIDSVQDAIRDMTDDAQSRASGLLTHMRETPQLQRLQTVFDERVAETLERIGVASKQSLDELNDKLDRVLETLEGGKAPARAKRTAKPRKKAAKKKTAKKKAAKKRTAKKPAAKRKVTKKAKAKKAPAKKASAKKPARKKAAKRKVAKKTAAK